MVTPQSIKFQKRATLIQFVVYIYELKKERMLSIDSKLIKKLVFSY
jgi:hypothetical protein